jgi:hypothetical protein
MRTHRFGRDSYYDHCSRNGIHPLACMSGFALGEGFRVAHSSEALTSGSCCLISASSATRSSGPRHAAFARSEVRERGTCRGRRGERQGTRARKRPNAEHVEAGDNHHVKAGENHHVEAGVGWRQGRPPPPVHSRERGATAREGRAGRLAKWTQMRRAAVPRLYNPLVPAHVV